MDFVVCGDFACVLHGVSRVTNDIDICVRLTDDNLPKLITCVRALGAQSRIPEPLDSLLDASRRESWVREKNAMVFTRIVEGHPIQIDVFLIYPIGYDELTDAADVLDDGDLQFRVSSLRHLIKVKSAVQPPREVDHLDIEDLRALMNAHEERVATI